MSWDKGFGKRLKKVSVLPLVRALSADRTGWDRALNCRQPGLPLLFLSLRPPGPRICYLGSNPLLACSRPIPSRVDSNKFKALLKLWIKPLLAAKPSSLHCAPRHFKVLRISPYWQQGRLLKPYWLHTPCLSPHRQQGVAVALRPYSPLVAL